LDSYGVQPILRVIGTIVKLGKWQLVARISLTNYALLSTLAIARQQRTFDLFLDVKAYARCLVAAVMAS
jgi:hypothetical protein